MENIFLKAKTLFIPCIENNYKPRFLESEFLFYFVIFLLVLKIIAVSFIFYFPKTVFFADITKAVLVELTNKERVALGVPALKESPTLNEAAYQKALDMLKYDYFSHQSPSGISPWYWFKKAGYNYRYAGENLAIGFLDSEEVVTAWENSPSHRANLLSPKYQETGMAVVKGDFQGSQTTIVVQLFGLPTVQKTETKSKETQTPTQPEKPKTQPPATTSLPETAGEEVTQKETTTTKSVIMGSEDFKIGLPPPEYLTNTFTYKFFSFMTLKYPEIIQKIIFFSLLFISLALVLNILIYVNIQDRKIILKTATFIILLIIFVVSDKTLLLQLIPHDFLI